MKLYANYGMLGHEKETVYSATAHGEIFDTIYVELPEGWAIVDAIGGIALESPWGWVYSPDEVITTIGDEPWIEARDKDYNTYKRKLRKTNV